MKKTAIVLLVLVVSVFLVGCGQNKSTGYATYNQQQQQGQYVGGGCGVAPSSNYADTSIDALSPEDSAL